MPVSIDTSYCTVEKIFGILPVVAVAPTQEARIVANAVFRKRMRQPTKWSFVQSRKK
jgi:hypothetical protein